MRLEEESGEWEFLAKPRAVPAPEAVAEQDAFQLDEELRRLVAKRKGWDELFRRLAMIVCGLGLWRDMKLVSFAHYSDERLGMSIRAVQQRWGHHLMVSPRAADVRAARVAGGAARGAGCRTSRRGWWGTRRTPAPWRRGSSARRG